MRNKTQERIEGLARERATTAIDLALVEDGIEIGKRMMAEMIATYPTAGKGAAAAPAGHGLAERTLRKPKARILRKPKAKLKWSRPSGSGYLNEVSSLTHQYAGEHREPDRRRPLADATAR